MSSRSNSSEAVDIDAPQQPVDDWLGPLPDVDCGEDLEYDAFFLELVQAVAGKPESQFAPAEPPVWPQVRDLCEGLLTRTRDLRVALYWVRAKVNLEGIEALPEGLRLLRSLLDRYWEQLHPALDPDDGDAFARIGVLGSMDTLDGLLGDVRQAALTTDRRLGGLRTRDVEIALDQLVARADESPPSASQIQGMLGDMPDLAARLQATCTQGRSQLLVIQRLMNDKFGADQAVDVKSLRHMLESIQSMLPDSDVESAGTSHDAGDASNGNAATSTATGARSASGPLSINSRQDAIKAINAVCAYLERSEPTNPAQLLLRRAERLIERNFLQLIRDLAPDAVAEVARIMGIDPDTIGREDERY